MDVNSPGLKNCVVMKDVACIFPIMSPVGWGAGRGWPWRERVQGQRSEE